MTRFARLVVKRQVEVTGGPSNGTTFSMEEACDSCGTGARQVGPLVLDRAVEAPFAVVETLDGEVLVSNGVSQQIRAAGLTCLGAVITRDGRELTVSQLRIEGSLPAFPGSTRGFVRSRGCTACGRDGHFDDGAGALRVTFDDLPASLLRLDVLASFERFGYSRLRQPFDRSVFARPLYILSERTVDILSRAAGDSVAFEWVELDLNLLSERGRSRP